MRSRRAVAPALALVAAACVVPPSFEGYEGAGQPPRDAGADTEDSGADAAADGAEAGPLPGFGEECAADGRCGPGLECASAWGLSDVVVMAGQTRWTCVAPCAADGDVCSPEGTTELGLCLDTLTSKGPACVKVCDASNQQAGCAEGFSCWQFSGGGGFGFCVAACKAKADCKLLPAFDECGLDGICSSLPRPSDPTLACGAATPCFCHPLPAGGGTCRIACEQDSDCPTHTPTGLQMVCPLVASSHPTYGSCAVPCDAPGPDPVCSAMGLVCSEFGAWNGKYTCLDE